MNSFLKNKKALIFPKGAVARHYTFSYAVAFGVFDKKYYPKNSGFITTVFRNKIIEDYNFEFFTPDVWYENGKFIFEDFEEKFDISLTVFCYDPKTNKIYCEKPMGVMRNEEAIILRLPNGSYACVKNLSRLLGSQISTTKRCRHVCTRCLNDFVPDSKKMKTHTCTTNVVPKHLKKEDVYGVEKPVETKVEKFVEEMLRVGERTSRIPEYNCADGNDIIGEGGWNQDIVWSDDDVNYGEE